MPEKSLKRRCVDRWTALKSERSSWMPHWEEISEVLTPRTGRFLVADTNKGDKRHRAILDNTGTRALRTLAGGMMAGMTSPARPWFRLTTKNPELDESQAVKEWLGQVTQLMLMRFNQSNVYRALHTAYEELGAYGTAAVIVLDDPDDVIHCMPLTIGEYAIATDGRGRVNTLYREFRMTVSQVVQEFGYGNCSDLVQKAFDDNKYDDWITVVNAIEPRNMRDPEKLDAKNMPFRSVYFEESGDDDKLLRESGFRHFPVLCGRWGVSGGDIYGTSPGMEALGDLKQLQEEQLQKSKAINYQSDPPILVPSDLKGDVSALLPGGTAYVDSATQAQMVRSAFDVRLDLNALLQDIQDVRGRVNEAFYKDIFLMLTTNVSNTDRKTATEVAELHEEKMLMLGPVLDRLNSEMLDPLIALMFDHLKWHDELPPVPDELQNIEINVDFVSILAQSQKAVTTNAIDRFTQALTNLSAIKPEAIDKLNGDRWADIYADSLGIDAQLVVPDADVQKIREARAQAQAQQAQMDQQQQAAATAKDVAGAASQLEPMSGYDINEMFAGY